MQDILKKYRKNKLLSNINIIIASLVLAIWVNFILIDWTNVWQNLKASVLNSKVVHNKSDISIEKINGEMYILANKKISNLESLSFSLIYNPDIIKINNIKSKYWNITNLTNTPWISSIILTSEKPVNVNTWDKLAIIKITKKDNKSENINIINANFKDSNSKYYSLSTSWITF